MLLKYYYVNEIKVTKLKSISLFQNNGLISVLLECFVAVALLSLQKTFAADASLSRRASWGASDQPLGATDVFCA